MYLFSSSSWNLIEHVCLKSQPVNSQNTDIYYRASSKILMFYIFQCNISLELHKLYGTPWKNDCKWCTVLERCGKKQSCIILKHIPSFSWTESGKPHINFHVLFGNQIVIIWIKKSEKLGKGLKVWDSTSKVKHYLTTSAEGQVKWLNEWMNKWMAISLISHI